MYVSQFCPHVQGAPALANTSASPVASTTTPAANAARPPLCSTATASHLRPRMMGRAKTVSKRRSTPASRTHSSSATTNAQGLKRVW